MQDTTDPRALAAIDEQIACLKNTAAALADRTTDFPALNRNLQRVLASVKMLELNLSDALSVIREDT
ncbi:MAG: hypothetical protein ACNA7H_09210 [Desulfotignum sp.]